MNIHYSQTESSELPTRQQAEQQTDLYVWGNDEYGQLGLSSKHSPLSATHLLPRICSYKLNIVQISCGIHHSAFVTNQGKVYCVGSNNNEALGIGNKNHSVKASSSPLLVEKLQNYHISSISCGEDFTFAITETGRVFVWGAGESGALGTGKLNNERSPVEVFFQRRMMKASCGKRHSLLLNDVGEVFASGDNSEGQLGIPQLRIETIHQNTFQSDIADVACGYFHSIILNTRGEVFACGLNSHGQLGINNKISSDEFKQVSFHNAKITQAGFHASAVINDQGEMFIWGSGSFGEYLSPTHFPKISSKFISISIGAHSGAGVDNKGIVWTWGLNKNGELGVGDKEARENGFPVVALGNRKVQKVSCGNGFTIALSFPYKKSNKRDQHNNEKENIYDNRAFNRATTSPGRRCNSEYAKDKILANIEQNNKTNSTEVSNQQIRSNIARYINTFQSSNEKLNQQFKTKYQMTDANISKYEEEDEQEDEQIQKIWRKIEKEDNEPQRDQEQKIFKKSKNQSFNRKSNERTPEKNNNNEKENECSNIPSQLKYLIDANNSIKQAIQDTISLSNNNNTRQSQSSTFKYPINSKHLSFESAFLPSQTKKSTQLQSSFSGHNLSETEDVMSLKYQYQQENEMVREQLTVSQLNKMMMEDNQILLDTKEKLESQLYTIEQQAIKYKQLFKEEREKRKMERQKYKELKDECNDIKESVNRLNRENENLNLTNCQLQSCNLSLSSSNSDLQEKICKLEKEKEQILSQLENDQFEDIAYQLKEEYQLIKQESSQLKSQNIHLLNQLNAIQLNSRPIIPKDANLNQDKIAEQLLQLVENERFFIQEQRHSLETKNQELQTAMKELNLQKEQIQEQKEQSYNQLVDTKAQFEKEYQEQLLQFQEQTLSLKELQYEVEEAKRNTEIKINQIEQKGSELKQQQIQLSQQQAEFNQMNIQLKQEQQQFNELQKHSYFVQEQRQTCLEQLQQELNHKQDQLHVLANMIQNSQLNTPIDINKFNSNNQDTSYPYQSNSASAPAYNFLPNSSINSVNNYMSNQPSNQGITSAQSHIFNQSNNPLIDQHHFQNSCQAPLQSSQNNPLQVNDNMLQVSQNNSNQCLNSFSDLSVNLRETRSQLEFEKTNCKAIENAYLHALQELGEKKQQLQYALDNENRLQGQLQVFQQAIESITMRIGTDTTNKRELRSKDELIDELERRCSALKQCVRELESKNTNLSELINNEVGRQAEVHKQRTLRSLRSHSSTSNRDSKANFNISQQSLKHELIKGMPLKLNCVSLNDSNNIRFNQLISQQSAVSSNNTTSRNPQSNGISYRPAFNQQKPPKTLQNNALESLQPANNSIRQNETYRLDEDTLQQLSSDQKNEFLTSGGDFGTDSQRNGNWLSNRIPSQINNTQKENDSKHWFTLGKEKWQSPNYPLQKKRLSYNDKLLLEQGQTISLQNDQTLEQVHVQLQQETLQEDQKMSLQGGDKTESSNIKKLKFDKFNEFHAVSFSQNLEKESLDEGIIKNSSEKKKSIEELKKDNCDLEKQIKEVDKKLQKFSQKI